MKKIVVLLMFAILLGFGLGCAKNPSANKRNSNSYYLPDREEANSFWERHLGEDSPVANFLLDSFTPTIVLGAGGDFVEKNMLKKK